MHKQIANSRIVRHISYGSVIPTNLIDRSRRRALACREYSIFTTYIFNILTCNGFSSVNYTTPFEWNVMIRMKWMNDCMDVIQIKMLFNSTSIIYLWVLYLSFPSCCVFPIRRFFVFSHRVVLFVPVIVLWRKLWCKWNSVYYFSTLWNCPES